MAKATIASPQPSIFTSDPIEQIYAKGTLDRDMSGLAGLLLLSAKNDRAQSEDKYLGSLTESNKMSAELARMQELFEFNKKRMEEGVKLAKEGFMPSGLQGLESLISDYKDADSRAMLERELIKSQIARNLRPPGGGGGGAGSKDRVTGEIIPWNGQFVPRIVTVGGTPEEQMDRQRRFYDSYSKKSPSGDPRGWSDNRKAEYLGAMSNRMRNDIPNIQE